MSDSERPHGLQPTGLLHPWDFPGKSTGVGCHHLLRFIHLTMFKTLKKTIRLHPFSIIQRLITGAEDDPALQSSFTDFIGFKFFTIHWQFM